MRNRPANNSYNIIKYPKQYHISIGFIIIGVIFIYVIYHLFTYITADNTTIYEVSQGSISSNLEYNALAIREEQIVNSEINGDILYLAENFERAGAKTKVYAVDSSGEILSSLAKKAEDSSTKLSQEDYIKIQSEVSNFVFDFDEQNYNKVYNFKDELESQVEQLYTVSAMNDMGQPLEDAINSGTFNIYNSQAPGLIVYSIDGLEDLTIDSFVSDSLDMSKYSSTNLKAKKSVEVGQPIYKLITSDHWNLICEIDKTLYDSLQNETYLEIKFLEDEVQTWATISFKEQAGKYYLILALDDSLDRYADSRFVHIKLIDNNSSGLKIPNSSIVKKEFFTIPKAYSMQGDNGDELGFVVEDGSDKKYIQPVIYYETDDYLYIDGTDVKRGDKLIKPNSNETYVVGADLDSLDGVYNVNKGYAVFKQIEVLYQNNDYSIIKSGTKHGISMYDHIVLQGDEVQENSIIN